MSFSRLYAVASVVVLCSTFFLLVKAGMATGGSFHLLQEASRETGAESIDKKLSTLQNDLSELEIAQWQESAKNLRSLSELSAKIVLVSFWASYCIPCTREWPSMLALVASLGPEKMQMLAVSYDESWEPLSDFFQKTTGEFPRVEHAIVMRDPQSDQKGMLKTHYGTDKIPETYVVVDGRLAYRFVNERDWQAPEMRRFFKRLLDVAR